MKYQAELFHGYTEDNPGTITAEGETEGIALLNLGKALAREWPNIDESFFDACRSVLNHENVDEDGWYEIADFSNPEGNYKIRLVRVQ